MGASASSLAALNNDNHISQLISKKHVSHRDDSFWYALLAREGGLRQ